MSTGAGTFWPSFEASRVLLCDNKCMVSTLIRKVTKVPLEVFIICGDLDTLWCGADVGRGLYSDKVHKSTRKVPMIVLQLSLWVQRSNQTFADLFY